MFLHKTFPMSGGLYLGFDMQLNCKTRGVDVYQRAGQGDLDRGDLEQWLRLVNYLETGHVKQFHIKGDRR